MTKTFYKIEIFNFDGAHFASACIPAYSESDLKESNPGMFGPNAICIAKIVAASNAPMEL